MQSRHAPWQPHTNQDEIFFCILPYLNISDLLRLKVLFPVHFPTRELLRRLSQLKQGTTIFSITYVYNLNVENNDDRDKAKRTIALAALLLPLALLEDAKFIYIHTSHIMLIDTLMWVICSHNGWSFLTTKTCVALL